MNHLFFSFLLVAAWVFSGACSQTNNPESENEKDFVCLVEDSIAFKDAPQNLDSIIKCIAAINEVQSEHIGWGGTPSENFRNYLQLKKAATTEQLVTLTDNENATVACYAGWALADESYSDLCSVFMKFNRHDRVVVTFSGCIRSSNSISSELYHRYWNNLEISGRPKDKILLGLDSAILFSKNPDWLLLIRALENRIYPEPYKNQISNLAFKDGRSDAIFYLCKWHRAEYADQLKPALLKYLKETEFKNVGTSSYYKTVSELLIFKDSEINNEVIAKLKEDRHWESDKASFMHLLADNYIYDIETEKE
jgi:hypothetical protein